MNLVFISSVQMDQKHPLYTHLYIQHIRYSVCARLRHNALSAATAMPNIPVLLRPNKKDCNGAAKCTWMKTQGLGIRPQLLRTMLIVSPSETPRSASVLLFGVSSVPPLRNNVFLLMRTPVAIAISKPAVARVSVSFTLTVQLSPSNSIVTSILPIVIVQVLRLVSTYCKRLWPLTRIFFKTEETTPRGWVGYGTRT